MRASSLAVLVLLCSACDTPSAVDAGVDSGRPDAGTPLPPWPSRLPPTTNLPTVRGYVTARTTLHVHSPLSHDACDGNGWVDGALADPVCLEHFRAALCALSLDAAMLTDHSPHLDEVAFEDGLWMQGDDAPVQDDGGAVIGSSMACPDGHRVLLTVGSENALMPVGLTSHPGATREEWTANYELGGAEGAAALRAAGALVWQAHTEQQSLETLGAIGLDGLEIYNLHANVGPDIREEFLGLDPFGYAPALFDFTMGRLNLPPDLALLAFLLENQPSLDRWDALLAEGHRITGSGGCDAHENALPMLLTDGERGDSYRRMMFFIENHLRVTERTPEGIDEALAAGRVFVVFEIFGTPVGVDFFAEDGSGVFEMGDDAPLGSTVTLVRPSLPEGWPADPPPTLSMRIVRSTSEGAVEVASGDGETLSFVADVPGPYRAEIRMVPEHAAPYLAARPALVREVPWVYSNPIFVE